MSTQQSKEASSSSWRLVHVFKGEQEKLPLPSVSDKIARGQSSFSDGKDEWADALFQSPANGYYGQVRQDFVVSSLLNFVPGGFFVDLAANDAYYISNTYALEQKLDWTGICIEANIVYWEDLARMRKCDVVAAAIGQKTGEEIKFRFSRRKEGFGGFVGDEFDNKPKANTGSNEVQSILPTVTLENVLKRFHAPKEIQYLSLDVEGAEFFIMEKFPFDQYIFQLVTVERPNPPLIQLFRKSGYRFVKKLATFGDMLFAHESILPQLNLTSVGIHKHWSELDKGEIQNQTAWEMMMFG